MWFILFFILLLAALAYGLEQVIDQPGSVTIDWGPYHLDASIPVAAAALLIGVAAVVLIWALISGTFKFPSRLRQGSHWRRRERGFAAVTKGIVAAASGDAATTKHAAKAAEKLIPNEPLVHYLKSQAAQIEGDFGKAEAAFQQMTLNPETRLLGLRGLHIQAQRRADAEAAHHFAKEAHEIAPLPWAGAALLEHLAAAGEWDEARKVLEENYKAGAIDAATAERCRAVLETAAAMQKEESDPHAALHLAHLALKRRPNFVPALLVATRILIRRNDAKLATKLIEKAWPNAPHPDLAAAYFDSFPAETNAQKLARAERLAALAPGAPESRQALAQAALSARNFTKARAALAPLVVPGKTPTAHTCLLMAEIEDAEFGPSGPVREWLARGSRAPRDPAWIADGVISRSWAPISPKTGRLDAFEWGPPPTPPAGTAQDGRPEIPAAFQHQAPVVAIASDSAGA
jgi:HemY protein